MGIVRRIISKNTRWQLRGGLVAVLLCVAPLMAGAQGREMARIDTFVHAEMARQKIPGVAIAIVKKEGVFAAKGYGFANVELHVPAGPDTIFQSGSLGKQFTSAVIMLLVEQGKIGLEDPVSKFFPDAPASWRAITVRHLLTHTSGLPDYEGVREGPAAIDLRRDYTEDELARHFFSLTLEFPPGTRWNYSNTGYVLLGIIIRKVSGQFYGDVLHERVFAPLGMESARVISEADIVPNRAAGYRLDAGVLKNQEWVSPTLNATADGALYFSVRDLIAWDKGLRSGAILSASSWEQVYDPVKLKSGNRYPYGFGWSVDTLNGKLRLHHSGSWQGFETYISRYLGEDLTIIVLANLAEADPGRFVDGIAAILVPALATPELKPIPDPDAATRARLDSLLSLTIDGQLSPTEFAYLRAGFFPDEAKAYQEQLSRLGAIQQVSLLERKPLGDDRVSTYELDYATESLIVTLGIAPDGKVSLFWIRSKAPEPG
jgi:CubicO group peptidase (beta-lactamase class C family)